MSRKSSLESEHHHGIADIIGLALQALAALLVIAQFSFDRGDISFQRVPPNESTHNWIGPVGAHLAHWFFQTFGFAAYVLPLIFGAFGLAYLFGLLGWLRERSRWSVLWAAMLMIAATGLLYIFSDKGWMGKAHERIGALSAGGFFGWLSFEYVFWMLGTAGAT